MDNNKRYDFKDGAAGCFVGVVISAVVTIVFILVVKGCAQLTSLSGVSARLL